MNKLLNFIRKIFVVKLLYVTNEGSQEIIFHRFGKIEVGKYIHNNSDRNNFGNYSGDEDEN